MDNWLPLTVWFAVLGATAVVVLLLFRRWMRRMRAKTMVPSLVPLALEGRALARREALIEHHQAENEQQSELARILTEKKEDADRILREKEERRAGIIRRFGEADAARILRQEVWQGQTLEALVEALGKPAEIDEKVMKTKTRQILKWGRIGANRFRRRVTVENGVVVGWER